MAITNLEDEIWTSLEDLQPFPVAGYVVAGPAEEEYGGIGHKLYGLFDTIEAANAWGDTNIGADYSVNVVWKP
jgi:hypothetical protein